MAASYRDGNIPRRVQRIKLMRMEKKLIDLQNFRCAKMKAEVKKIKNPDDDSSGFTNNHSHYSLLL